MGEVDLMKIKPGDLIKLYDNTIRLDIKSIELWCPDNKNWEVWITLDHYDATTDTLTENVSIKSREFIEWLRRGK
jgi:hypothetical protein